MKSSEVDQEIENVQSSVVKKMRTLKVVKSKKSEDIKSCTVVKKSEDMTSSEVEEKNEDL